MNQVSEQQMLVLVKRETGANPVRTRHRKQGAIPIYHWVTGKMVNAVICKPGDLPGFKYGKRKLWATSNWLYVIFQSGGLNLSAYKELSLRQLFF